MHQSNSPNPVKRNGFLNGWMREFPPPLTILVSVLCVVWIATFFIPSGAYILDETGSPIPGSFRTVPKPLSFPEHLGELPLAPVNGLYGAVDPETGQVAPFNIGPLFGSAPVFFYVLAIGGFMTVVFATGALDRGIHHLAWSFRSQGEWLIVVLCLLFGVLGSVMFWSDESLGLYALMIPLIIALGYDRMTTVAVVTVAPFAGRLASTINPFVIGIGSDKAGITLVDGLPLRLVMFCCVMAVLILYVLRYAKRVKNNPQTSISGISEEDKALAEADALPPPKLSRTDKIIVSLVAGTFSLMTFSIVPWGAILGNAKIDAYEHESINSPFAWELGWWLPELTALFCVMAIVVGAVGRLGQAETARAFLRGVGSFVGPAFLIVVARGISVLMTNTKTIDTVLHTMEGLTAGASSSVFTLVIFLVSMPLAFLVGGGSAGTALVIPVLAPLADFAGIERSLVLTAWSTAGGVMSLILPTNAILMAGLALAKVGYDQYIRFILPLVIVFIGIAVFSLLIGSLLL
ncbi:hypothetical protein PUV47_18795 [Pseudovibrio exalbescens]|uniref:YfcC family protein n=1 Tax=Pseudovibrio exalbescens TaxID=197461 RepID=UPI0023660EC6|nr:hypothetical protein [Pseudovibrio exalbescens]MDD7911985.1 hypothetical protein [Pseudovibrio exalbescens]